MAGGKCYAGIVYESHNLRFTDKEAQERLAFEVYDKLGRCAGYQGGAK
jgi:hypothetical protein